MMHLQAWKLNTLSDQPRYHWLILLVVLFSAACAAENRSRPTPTPIEPLSVDPVFREFYRHLGGEEILGPPISPVFIEGTATIQYVQKAKMVFDPSRSIRQRFTLAPLGAEMGVIEPPVLPPEQPGYKYDSGHVIAPEFLPLYEKLGGYVVGKPLTELRYYPVRRRHEQFFESVGFYRLEGSDQVRLLDYGVWACGERCKVQAGTADAAIDLITRIDPVFVQFINHWGADFTGFAISEAYVNNEGNWEQIFENVVLQANSPTDPTSVTVKPLTRQLNISPDTPQEFSKRPDQQFYEQEDGRGYEIPNYFAEYLKAHGGFGLSGAPITHLAPLNGSVLHQCFENLCLMYDPQAPPAGRVRPQPIGHAYKTLYHSTKRVTPQPASELLISVWERYPYVLPGQEQEIGVSVMQNSRPLVGVQPTLILTLLDGSERAVPMNVTDASGRSGLLLAPIEGPSGSLIEYKICLPLPPEQETCKEDSFVLWNTP